METARYSIMNVSRGNNAIIILFSQKKEQKILFFLKKAKISVSETSVSDEFVREIVCLRLQFQTNLSGKLCVKTSLSESSFFRKNRKEAF